MERSRPGLGPAGRALDYPRLRPGLPLEDSRSRPGLDFSYFVVKLFALLMGLTLWTGCAGSVPLQQIDDAGISRIPSQKGLLVLNFWATWCEPCVEEIPIFVRLQEHRKDVRIIGISMDNLEQEKEVEKFASAHHMRYELLLRNGNDFETMVNSLDPDWIGGLPATFVYQDGKRVFSKTALITEQELLKALELK